MSRYFILYKPYGMMSQFSPEGDKPVLADLGIFPPRVYPVGRLDADSEGLLLLTDDTALNQQLLHPRYRHQRQYWVQVEGLITEEALQRLSEGVELRIDGQVYYTLPAQAKRIPEPDLPPRHPPIRFRQHIPTSWISLELTEGKNRQVRRMTAAVGFPTLRLVRAAIGRIELEDMQPGEVHEMSRQAVYSLLGIR